MAEITNLSEVRQKKKKKSTRKGIFLMVLVLVLTLVLSLLFSSSREYGVESFMDLFQAGEGFPVEAPGGKSKGMYDLNGLLCIVNDTDLTMYNSNGGEAFRTKHQMADPQLKIKENMLLMFDQGAKSYALYQKNVPMVDSDSDYMIYTGAVSAKGNFALATRSEDYLSQVTVYDENNAPKYTWNYSNKIVSSVAMSPNGSKLAVCGLFTEEGTIKSQLLLYNNGELVDSREFDDALICSLVFVNESQIRGVTDQGAFLISDKGRLLGEYDYKAQPLAAFSNTEDGTVLLLGDYRQDGGYDVVSLNNEMNRRSSSSIKGNIHVMKADAHNAYILAGSKYYQIDLLSGEQLVAEESEYLYDLQPIGKGVFAITNEEIIRMEQVKSEERGENSVIPEQSKADEEVDDWDAGEETPSEEPSETPPAETPEEVPEVPEKPQEIIPSSGTNPQDPGL